MTETTFAEAADEYEHRVCVPLGIGLCGQPQADIIWFSRPCSACELIYEMTAPGRCALKEGPCDCFTNA